MFGFNIGPRNRLLYNRAIRFDSTLNKASQTPLFDGHSGYVYLNKYPEENVSGAWPSEKRTAHQLRDVGNYILVRSLVIYLDTLLKLHIQTELRGAG